MNAFPALRALACASLFSILSATNSSAQLFFHVVDQDSEYVDSGNNLGVAINATFDFNYGGTAGLLRLTLTNLAGTSRAVWGDGLGNYTDGILTGFGFDAPAGATYVAGSFTQTLSPLPSSEPGGILFAVNTPYVEVGSLADFDIGAASIPPPVGNGLSGGYTAIFTYQYAGDLTHFNADGFFANNGSDPDFGFRFQSIPIGEGSDKFVYNPPIPEPSTYGLVAASVLLGLVGVKRYRSSKAVAAK